MAASLSCCLRKVEQFTYSTRRPASSRSRATPFGSTNKTFARSSWRAFASDNGCSLTLRSSSTHGPTSQPSSASRTLCSDSLINEIFSTCLVPLNEWSKSKLCANGEQTRRSSYVIEQVRDLAVTGL